MAREPPPSGAEVAMAPADRTGCQISGSWSTSSASKTHLSKSSILSKSGTLAPAQPDLVSELGRLRQDSHVVVTELRAELTGAQSRAELSEASLREEVSDAQELVQLARK